MSQHPIRSFRDLEVWQIAMDLVVSVYKVANRFPSSEKFELSAQVRRAAVSVPSNIAEGHAQRRSRKTYLRHVRIALGSLAELDTDIELAVRLQMVSALDVQSVVVEIRRTGQLLHGLARALNRQQLNTAMVWVAVLGSASILGALLLQ
jgi:four helix bundle protein